jgi:hypothetical protein
LRRPKRQGPNAAEAIVLNAEEKRLLKYISQSLGEDPGPDSKYAVAVNIAVRFVRSKAKEAIAVTVTNDPNAPAVRLTEDQILERYPWDYYDLTRRCRERYANFKIDKKYHGIRKGLEPDKRYAHVRLLDPDNPKSPKKAFFSPQILEKLDSHFNSKR